MQKFAPFGIILIICATCAVLPLPWNEDVENFLVDLQFKIRGSRSFSEDIVVIYIGDKDINALNGWPISRDFYGYAINTLSESGSKVIAIDILFSRPDLAYPEYDKVLAGFIQAAGNICLPMYFSNFEKDTPDGPMYSLSEFIAPAAGMGFSNLSGESTIRKVPLLVSYQDSIYTSFGTEAARLYLGKKDIPIQIHDNILTIADSNGTYHTYSIDDQHRIRLNHFGDINTLQNISFTEFLKNPEVIDFEDKLVFLINTASGLATARRTPINNFLPASLLHVTLSENLLQDNYIRDVPIIVQGILIVLLVLSIFIALKIKNTYLLVFVAFMIPVLAITMSTVIFSRLNFALPLFYPLLAYLLSGGYHLFRQFSNKDREDRMMHELLSGQIQVKEQELEAIKSQFNQLRIELEHEAEVTEKSKQLAEERKSEIARLEKELADLRLYMIPDHDQPVPEFEQIVCAPNSKMNTILELVRRVSSDDIAVLLIGETGTGKELIARAIHNTGKRKSKTFVAVNCGALSETLLESELFGHEKGSFTGAVNQRRGRFELAHEGTIFLDEISETSNTFQAKLLRVLQEGTFERVGGERKIVVNVRIIAATNKNLQDEMQENRFRSDLFYRLNGFPIFIPPLRERTADIPLLARHFLNKYHEKSVSHFSDRAVEVMLHYPWPGNVRELENIIRRAALLAKSDSRQIIQVRDLNLDEDDNLKLQSFYTPFEDQILDILRSLKFEHTAIKKTAKLLGNRDRGTITEYFRGLCFMQLVESNFDVKMASQVIAGTSETDTIQRVEAKVNEYMHNIQNQIHRDHAQIAKGLPKKFHQYLHQVIEYLKNAKRHI